MKKTRRLTFLTILFPLLLTACDLVGNNSNSSSSTKESDEIAGLTLIDNVYYRVNEKGYGEVMQFKDVESIEIKSEIEIKGDRYPVRAISSKSYIDSNGRSYFSYNKVASLTIPHGISSINECGLAYFKSLKELTLPSSLTHLAQGALYYTKIEEITLPSFCNDYGFLSNKENIFTDSDSPLNNVYEDNLNAWLEEHSDDYMNLARAFVSPDETFPGDHYHWDSSDTSGNKPQLKRVTISSGEYLGPYALAYLSLNEVHFPFYFKGSFGYTFKSAKNFNAYFASMENFLSLKCDNKYSCVPLYSSNIFIKDEKLKDIIVPEGIKEIPAYSFYNLRDVEKVSLPSSLESVGYSAFRSFGSAKTSYYKNGFYFGNDKNPYVMLAYTSENIDKFEFHPDCQVFTETSFDNTRTYINSVTFNEKIKVIPMYAFSTMDRTSIIQLKEVEFVGENNIEVINQYAFYGAILKEFTFGKNIKLIGKYAFDHSLLETIQWPDQVNNLVIEDFAFGSNLNLNNEIVIPDGTVEIGRGVFPINIDKTWVITIPKSLVKYPQSTEHDYEAAGMFLLSHDKENTIVNPIIYYEGNHKVYYHVFDSLVAEIKYQRYGNLLLTNYLEDFSFSKGALYMKGETSVTFYGFAREFTVTKTTTTIPDTIIDLPVETIELFRSDTRFTRSSILRLNKSLKKLILTRHTPTNIVADLSIEEIDNTEDRDGSYKLYFLGSEEEYKVVDTPSNVSVFYYSETQNKDGHHWHWSDTIPTIWE